MSHKSQIPTVIREYFKTDRDVTVREVWVRGRGWRRPTNKVISLSKMRGLRRAGVEMVAVEFHGRVADFSIEEVTR